MASVFLSPQPFVIIYWVSILSCYLDYKSEVILLPVFRSQPWLLMMSKPSDPPGSFWHCSNSPLCTPPDTPGANSRNFLTSCFFLERETVGNFCELGCNYFLTNMSCLSCQLQRPLVSHHLRALFLNRFHWHSSGWVSSFLKMCSTRKVQVPAAVAELLFCGFMLVTL
jgi:hypothetical protein